MAGAPNAGATAGELFRYAVDRFRKARLAFGHGMHDARDEAAYLVFHCLGLPPGDLAEHRACRVTPVQHRIFERLVERRIRERIPAAYLTHEAWLGDYSFYVDKRVIVPRSFIAELLRDGFLVWMKRPARTVLDLCTGSGCLAVLAAHAFPRARIDASDISRGALSVAQRNVAHYALQERVRLLRSDLFSGLHGRRYDLILCNPPYVNAAAMRALPPEYRHEPRLALSGGADGLDAVRRILREAGAHLNPGGVLVCEIGRNRRALERAFPQLAFVWLDTSAGGDHVFLIEREALTRTDRLPSTSSTARRAR
jgi:ribosomal protein L3 glutamine methyltransferase